MIRCLDALSFPQKVKADACPSGISVNLYRINVICHDFIAKLCFDIAEFLQKLACDCLCQCLEAGAIQLTPAVCRRIIPLFLIALRGSSSNNISRIQLYSLVIFSHCASSAILPSVFSTIWIGSYSVKPISFRRILIFSLLFGTHLSSRNSMK